MILSIFSMNSKHKILSRNFLSSMSILPNLRFFSDSSLNIFDRKAKKIHRDWSASQQNGKIYDYLKEEVCYL